MSYTIDSPITDHRANHRWPRLLSRLGASFFAGQPFGLDDTFFRADASIDSTGMGLGSVTGQTGFTVFGNDLQGSIGGDAGFGLAPPSGLTLQQGSANLAISGTIHTEESLVALLAGVPGFEWPSRFRLRSRTTLH